MGQQLAFTWAISSDHFAILNFRSTKDIYVAEKTTNTNLILFCECIIQVPIIALINFAEVFEHHSEIITISLQIIDCCKQSLKRLFHPATHPSIQDYTFLSFAMQLIFILIINFFYKTVLTKLVKQLFTNFILF